MKQAPAFWEDINPISLLLWPFSILFSWIAKLRKLAYETNFLGFFKSQKLPVPVIIVGNIRVGGTGKTPIVITLAKELVKLGFRPGIISRGYVQSQEDQKQTNDGLEVVSNASPAIYGDEPVLMAKLLSSLNIPVFIGKKRYATGVALLKKYPTCDVIISDDGLQHYALARHPARIGGHDIEIVVRDARGEGSTFVLPAGPLREPADRPRDVTLQTGLDLQLTPTKYLGVPIYLIQVELGLAYRLNRPEETLPLQSFATKKVLAAAGLGHPQKFFDILSSAGLGVDSGADSGTEADSGGDMKTLPLPDHFSFESNPFEDPAFSDREAILITEKDAVKCQSFTDPRLWVVPLEAKLPEQFLQWIKTTIQKPAVQASSK